MIRVTLKGIAARRLRAALTALAIVLGVAMVSGTFAFTDRIDKAVDALFTGAYTGADAVVSGTAVPADLRDRIAALPEVDAVSGGIVDTARLVDRTGRPISTQDAALGLSVDASGERFNPLRLTAGRWPAGARETAIDAGTARQYGYLVGDTIGVIARGPVERMRITGIADFRGLRSLGDLTFAIFDVPTAQALFDKSGRLDEIWVAARPGITPEALVRRLRLLTPTRSDVATGSAKIGAEARDTDHELAKVRKFLLAFGGIALFVGAFVIFNTLSITITQRTRELATLRTLGASRHQVLSSVVLESIVIGVVGSVVGLFLGLGLAQGLAALFTAAGQQMPDSGGVLAARTVVASLLAGVSITLVSGLAPALRATRVPPVAAVREGSTLPPSRLAPYATRIAVAAMALGLGAISFAVFADGLDGTRALALLGLGCVVLFVGVALVSPALVRPLAAVVGWPGRRIAGTAGRLARENAIRNPNRTATTAAALMIYLALVTFVAVLGQGMRTAVTAGVERVVTADYVISADDGASPLPAAIGDAVAERAPWATVSGIRAGSVESFGTGRPINGFDPATIEKVVRFDWDPGAAADLTRLGAGGAVVQHDFAAAHDLRVGSRLSLKTESERLELTVQGIYTPPGLDPILAPIAIARSTFDAMFERPQDAFALVRGDRAPDSLVAALRGFPTAQVQTLGQFRDTRAKDINETLSVLYALLALTVIVSLLGMINTLVLSVFERTRELGLLRAIGMTRRQVRRMIRHESVITALIGAALGLPLGIALAALVTRALAEQGVALALPVPALALFVLTAIVAGVLAAIFPARRAARLDVLQALHHD